MKKKVLLLCTHNSCRSQLAEGIVNHFLGDEFEGFSAGTVATRVNPRAAAALAEIGIDISSHTSKTLEVFEGERFDYVITLCGSANKQCPLFFGGVRRTHLGFEDPSTATGTEDEIMAEFRKARDEIKERLTAFLKNTEGKQ